MKDVHVKAKNMGFWSSSRKITICCSESLTILKSTIELREKRLGVRFSSNVRQQIFPSFGLRASTRKVMNTIFTMFSKIAVVTWRTARQTVDLWTLMIPSSSRTNSVFYSSQNFLCSARENRNLSQNVVSSRTKFILALNVLGLRFTTSRFPPNR